MKIYTNEANPLNLKLLLLAKFAKVEVTLEHVNLNDATGKDFLVLPTLELDNGTRLFSTDAVAQYLFRNESAQCLEWLEWSTMKLIPTLAHHTAQRANPKALPVLQALLLKLEKCLANTKYLTGDKISAADLSIWSLLTLDGVLKVVGNIDKLLKWQSEIGSLPEVKSVLEKHDLKCFSLSALQRCNRYGGFQHIPLESIAPEEVEQTTTIAETLTAEELAAVKTHFKHAPYVAAKEPRTVLPKAGERNVLVTSALPYVNNVPHLGNIIGCVLSADIFARYARMAGYNTLYICGTDEYGTATENKAIAENLTPKQICDKYFELHNSIYRWFGIGFDYFGRTTTAEQTEIVQAAFKDVYDNGFIITESVEQLLCQKCDRFLADRFVEGTCPYPICGYEDARGDQCDKCGKLVNATELIRPRCKVCNTAPVKRSSEQLFIDLPKIEPKLREFVDKVDQGWTNNARVITKSWIREGLKPRCITRDLKWGVPVPLKGFENKVFYVWFDAPFGYVSISKRYTKDYQQWWQPAKNVNVEYFQFMAKDNVPFHGIMWPAVLLAINKGHTLVSHIMATEYLNYEDGKFSKSRGIGVFGNDAQDTGIAADVWRFYLASARPEGQDSSFSWNDLASRNNSELLNNLGNFVNRALVFCEKNFNSTIPTMTLSEEDVNLLGHINREYRGYITALERAKMRDGIKHLLAISRHGNGYMQAQQPWVLLKGNEEQKARAGSIIATCCNIAALLANLIFPYMPTTARSLYAQLNIQQTKLNADAPFITQLLPAAHKIGKPAPLFQKLEQAFIDELKAKYGGTQATNGNKASQATGKLANVADLEKAIQVQGEKVRDLKSKTKDKAVWQPEVNILLDLKKQLAAAQAATTTTTTVTTDASKVADLEKAVQIQGEKVRDLKSKSKDKAVWQPELNILLDLKKQLAAAQAATTTTTTVTVDAQKVADLEQEIVKQGLKVRTLKSSADASVWKPEVEVLLALKQQLASLTGAPPATTGKNKKK